MGISDDSDNFGMIKEKKYFLIDRCVPSLDLRSAQHYQYLAEHDYLSKTEYPLRYRMNLEKANFDLDNAKKKHDIWT
jgi:hypothetical protein